MIRRLLLALPLAIAMPLAAQVAEGNRAWAAGRYPEAEAAYARELAANPTSVRALYRLAVLASWRGGLDSSLALLARARAVEPGDPDVRVTQAQVLAWKGRNGTALALYDSVLAETPERRDAALGRARVLAWSGRYAASDSAYRALLLADPDDAEAMTGRAQVAHWTGHDREAGQLVGRALIADSTSRDAAALRRDLRAGRAPSVETSFGWNNDSDHDTNWFEQVTLATGLASGLRVFGTGGLQQSSDPVRSASRSLAEAGFNLVTPSVTLTGAGGVRRLNPDGAASRSVGTYRASVAAKAAAAVRLVASFSHAPFDDTAFLIGSGLDVDALDGEADIRLSPSVNAGVGGGRAWINDGNRRVSAVAGLTKTVGRHAYVGVAGRLLDYEQHGIGYFSPDRFGMGEARAGYTVSGRGWEGRLSAGGGVQQTSGSAAQGEWHVEGRAARRWGALDVIELFGGVTNSVASSVSGAFRYRYAGLRAVIAF